MLTYQLITNSFICSLSLDSVIIYPIPYINNISSIFVCHCNILSNALQKLSRLYFHISQIPYSIVNQTKFDLVSIVLALI